MLKIELSHFYFKEGTTSEVINEKENGRKVAENI
jgi:hypothetical protein